MFYKNISKRCLPPDPFAVVGRWMLSRPLGEFWSPLEPPMSLEEGAMAAGSRHFNASSADPSRCRPTSLFPSAARPSTHPSAPNEGAPGPHTPGGAHQRARGPRLDCQHGAAVARGPF